MPTAADLLPWEQVLQSSVAVLLLLVAICMGLGRAVWVLWRRNQQLNDRLIEYLTSGATWTSQVAHVGDLVALSRTLTPQPNAESSSSRAPDPNA